MNGQITLWDDATIHVTSEALIRGVSVFEGIKGYWSHDCREFSLLALRQHYDRLRRSAQLLHLPFSMEYDGFREACASLTKRLLSPEKDLWLRTTLLAVEGHWGEGTVTDLVITGYHQEKDRPTPIDVGVSTWQRPGDAALPARIKSAANYQIGRLARIEARRQGLADMVLLNSWGRVAEASGSCVLVVRDGIVLTPPSSEGCLESITVDTLEKLSTGLAIRFERRPLDRTELYVANEMCLAGTLAELIPIRRIDSHVLPERTPILQALADEFWACARADHAHSAVDLTPV
jgi:branched-chain amino acid aminotransferase